MIDMPFSYIVFFFILGGSICYLLSQYGVFSEDVMISYAFQTLRGLAYLHDNHILHRDLKGNNTSINNL
jgi:serine/threonine protein kinase